jgi:hypothetical protein
LWQKYHTGELTWFATRCDIAFIARRAHRFMEPEKEDKSLESQLKDRAKHRSKLAN